MCRSAGPVPHVPRKHHRANRGHVATGDALYCEVIHKQRPLLGVIQVLQNLILGLPDSRLRGNTESLSLHDDIK